MKTYSSVPSENEQTALVNCPVCKSDKFKFIFWDLDSYNFSKCEKCGLIMQNPQPHFEDIEKRYDSNYCNYEIENSDTFLNLMLLGLKDVKLFERLEIPKHQSGKFLDIGCATGALVEKFSKDGWDSTGVELCKESAVWGRENRNINIIEKPIDECNFGIKKFDLIHASHLIEHLNKPDKFVSDVFNILAPGGLFACVTPNSSSLQRLLFSKNWRSAIADHLSLFSFSQLKQLLKSAEFEIVDSATWGGLAVNSAPNWLKRIVDKSIKLTKWGDVMIILARKPS